jgi:hypothetical protein
VRYKVDGNKLSYKYDKVVRGFAMPIRVMVNGKTVSITATESTQTLTNAETIKTFEVDRNYYVDTGKL